MAVSSSSYDLERLCGVMVSAARAQINPHWALFKLAISGKETFPEKGGVPFPSSGDHELPEGLPQ